MSLPTAKQVARKNILFGVMMLVAGLWMTYDGVNAYRTGEVIHTLRHGSLQWWEELPLAVCAILIGGYFLAEGFGWVKPRGGPTNGIG